VLLLSLAVAALVPRAARAEASCEGPGDSVVLVAFTGTAWPAELRTGVLEHLRAGLGPTGFRVCDSDDARGVANVATVELRRNAGERVTATIEVRDGVTEKRVARDIDLSALPEDARALGVGVAADELLRASWIELSLAGAPKPALPPPPAVRRAVETSLRVERPSRSDILLLAGGEGYSTGLVLLGGDLAFRQRLGEVLGFGVSLGLRQSGTERSLHGTVSASVFGAGGSLIAWVLRRERLNVALEAGVWASEVRVRGRPDEGSAGTEASAVAVEARGGTALEYRLAGPLWISVRGGIGAPMRAVAARDYGASGTGVSGFEWYAALGPGVAF
jgi:hypothetical protein